MKYLIACKMIEVFELICEFVSAFTVEVFCLYVHVSVSSVNQAQSTLTGMRKTPKLMVFRNSVQ
ncbi:hypothetical protein, partial [Thiolapillus sp.]|uniref:hypothetical protein n=1 Tax=Thiolapillus sp. TaxID=2017437 RepID=UPI0025CE013A